MKVVLLKRNSKKKKRKKKKKKSQSYKLETEGSCRRWEEHGME